MIRVLIVDDSAVLRQQMRLILQSDPQIQVIGEARNGEEAIAQAQQLRPDVITMDLTMPKMDGFEAIRGIMASTPVPIVVVSSNDTKQGQEAPEAAMKLGAVSVLKRPGSIADPGYRTLAGKLIEQVKLMSGVKVVSRSRTLQQQVATPPPPPAAAARRGPVQGLKLVVIGSSTGGPAALYTIISNIPADFPLPILIVQHISFGFVGGLAGWLAGGGKLPVKVAEHGERMQPGLVLVAPDERHLTVDIYGRVRLKDSGPVGGHRPSVTVLFQSVAECYGSSALAVILTGMGADGAVGMRALKNAGATTIAQDQKSCVVFGMPKEAIALGAIDYVLPLDKIASQLVELCRKEAAAPKVVGEHVG